MTAREMSRESLEDRQRDVYESHRHRVFSVSYYMTGSEIEAEDLLRGTFISAFRQAEEPDQAMIDAALIERLKARMVLEDGELVFVPGVAVLPGGRNIQRADLEEAIRCLPANERLVFLLMDVEGYAADQIAGLLHKGKASILRTALTARLRLRSELAAMLEDGQQAA